ncbi:hypothetical protein AMIS_29810 [Actinoplanes missouriensis 431]|uniref:Uncharacterized protein n=1 Tax=Actinoplanes missouriensis (strain ATCC 14538 / DSM 43046 / CBS 188.64 / JCM 3121 / NBRC 102363 / NCIMB 12654 / NRRL B-3342 / UNCC 431) TaxID=512565 RepID=I0H5B4_ACTM4|nr:hypothetical protein [Actinoplanes missouriensis]BAL88201.1 hypothetical protein AMIS_29810 [Actinoplanes missouriensis 431]
MTMERGGRLRVDEELDRFGGPPGPYAVVCVVMAVIWFLVSLPFDRDDGMAVMVVDSGGRGAVWAPLWLALGWAHRRRTGAGGPSFPTAAARRRHARRGAVIGLGVGVPFFGGLIALCLGTGQSSGYVVIFAVVLVVMAVLAVRAWLPRSGGA